MKNVLNRCYLLFAFSAASQAATLPTETKLWSVSHGEHVTIEGRSWRFHQKHANIWQGVDPDEWDDNIHVKRDSVFERPPYDATTDLTKRSLERRLLKNTCKRAISCIGAGVTAGQEWTDNNWEEILQWVNWVCKPVKFLWKCANQPIIATAMGPVSGNILLYTNYEGLFIARDNQDLAQQQAAEPNAIPTIVAQVPNTGSDNTDIGDPMPHGAPSISPEIEADAWKNDPPVHCSAMQSEWDVMYCLGKDAINFKGANGRTNWTMAIDTPKGNRFTLTVSTDPPPAAPKCGGVDPNVAPMGAPKRFMI